VVLGFGARSTTKVLASPALGGPVVKKADFEMSWVNRFSDA